MTEEVGGVDFGRFLSRFKWVVTSPKLTFADVAAGAHWWEPWVWVSVINMVIAYISVPIQIQLARLNPRDLPEDQVQQTLEAMEKFGFLGVISTPVVILLTSLIIAGVSYVAVSVLAEKADFKKYFTTYLWASVVSSLGMLLGTVLTRMKGVESIRSFEDAMSSFGPAILVSPDQRILRGLLNSLDLFQLWFYLLVGIGVMRVFNLSQRSAILVVIPVWLVFVLVSLVSARLAG